MRISTAYIIASANHIAFLARTGRTPNDRDAAVVALGDVLDCLRDRAREGDEMADDFLAGDLLDIEMEIAEAHAPRVLVDEPSLWEAA